MYSYLAKEDGEVTVEDVVLACDRVDESASGEGCDDGERLSVLMMMLLLLFR